MISPIKTSPLEIRPIVAEDFAQWLSLWEGYLAFYQTSLTHEVTQTTWERFLNPAEPMFAHLALLDGQAVGLVHSIDHRSCWTPGNYCYLQDLYVQTDHRGHGVGRKLIEEVYQQAQLRGCSRVHWLTHQTNTDAMVLYDQVAQKSGFVQYQKVF